MRRPLTSLQARARSIDGWAFALTASAVSLLAASLLVVLASGRGIDLTDESYYLVSYRSFRTVPLVHVGSPAILGPLFAVLGHSVTALRLVRLVLHVGCAAALGWVVARFVDDRLPEARRGVSRRRRAAIVTLVASGAMTMYAWLPPTPSYNDVSMMAATLVGAALIGLRRSHGDSRGWALALGASLAVAVVNKWSAAVAMAAIALAVLAAMPALFRHAIVAVRAALGAAISLALMWLVSGNPFARLAEVMHLSRHSLSDGGLMTTYFDPYRAEAQQVAHELLGSYGWLPFGLATGTLLVRTARRQLGLFVLLGCGALAAVAALRDGLLEGGAGRALSLSVMLPWFAFFAGSIRFAEWTTGGTVEPVAKRSGSLADLAVVAALPVLAVAQGVGTDSFLFRMAAGGGALVFGAAVVAWSGSARRTAPVCGAAWLPLAVVALLAPTMLVLSGTWQHPYRLAGSLGTQDTVIRAPGPFHGLRTDAATADLLDQLAEVASRRATSGRPGFSAFATPGLALQLGLASPTAALWVRTQDDPDYLPLYRHRIVDACARGFIGAAHKPVIVAAGEPGRARLDELLAGCGISLNDGYTAEIVYSKGLPAVPAGPLTIWIPDPAGG